MDLAGQHISIAELAGTLTGLGAVWLTVKENRLCFPLGIVSCLVYAGIFLSPAVRLYSDAVLQVIYILLLAYGWFSWKPGKNVSAPAVTRLNKTETMYVSGFILAGGLTAGSLFKRFTNADLPYLDAIATAISLAAQWMVARKKIENWYLWIGVNIVYVVMYIYKELYITSFFYLILLLMAIAGTKQWKKHLAT